MTACAREGCGGTIVDGYCDTCGMAPSKAEAAASGATGSGRSTSRTSGRVDVSRMSAGGIASGVSGPSSRRSRVGGGVVDITPVPAADPDTLVMADPTVPESRRYCSGCEEPVGRAHDGQPGRVSGFCSNCRKRFDFAAKLAKGDVVADQYEVMGALAHGGLGWIYLARDRNVSMRPCVLKGLLDEDDPAAVEAALVERQFLAEVAHPAIVDIYNFVKHGGQGYIVMEFVGGPSVKQIRERHRQETGQPMPVAEAAAYLLSVLPAFTYLHERGLVYCDFKPDNVIHVGDAVQLIDLGGVRRLDDAEASIFGTPGYQAPEVPRTGPTIASDLYTVGRALAVLILDWPEWQRADRERLPRREDHEVLVEHESLWRFLERACAPDPEQRFRDAEEMAEALQGVLRQVAAADDGAPRPPTSTLFSPARPQLGRLDWRLLPVPLLPAHPRLANVVAGMGGADPAATIGMAATAMAADSAGGGELSWADLATVARARCEIGDHAGAAAAVELIDPLGPDAGIHRAALDTTRSYLRGVVGLAAGDADAAVAGFDAAYATAPGELATMFAFAASLEASGDPAALEQAAALYQRVAVTDPAWVAATAGLARALVGLDRPADAARVMVTVPPGHPLRAEALTLAVRALNEAGAYDDKVVETAVQHLRSVAPASGPTSGPGPGSGPASGPPGGQDGRDGRNGGNARDSRGRAEAELAVELYSGALAAAQRGETVGRVLGDRPASVPDLAQATEQALLDLADVTSNRDRRHALLDAAARTRPWSLW
jgi:serine/threonine-protein kinase PknG